MRILWFLLRTSRRDVALGALAGILAGLGGSGFALVLQQTIAAHGAGWRRNLAEFLACWVAYGLGSVLASNRLTRVAQRAVRELRMSLSRQILATPLPILEREGTRIFGVLVEDIGAISAAAERLPSVFTGVVTVAGCAAILAYISPQLTAACFALILLAVPLYLLPLRKFEHHLSRWRVEWDRLAILVDALARGNKELILDRRKRQSFLGRHLDPLCRLQEGEMVRAQTWETLLSRWGELLLALGLGALLFTLPLHHLATYEQFGRFLFVSLFLLSPLATIVGVTSLLTRANVAVARSADLGLFLAESRFPAETRPGARSVERAEAPPSIELADFAYRHIRADGSSFDLGPVSLAFDRPELVFICGGNGSGKTTMLKLLCGLYEPTSGELRVDGIAVERSQLPRHRERFAAVFADFFLFDSLLGYEESPAAEGGRLLDALQLSRHVRIGPEGEFSSTALSQGQRKRLALVAALLEDKAIYIFDEWAADQDPEFRKIFYHELLPALRDRGKLVIAITHDETYFGCADRMIHLADGRVVEDTRRPQAWTGRA